jgi:aryl-alcohol dehydrogenase-like predicted oxidoreductase
VDGVLRSAAAAALPHALFVDTEDVYCHPHTSLHQSERAVAAVQSSLGSSAASLVVSTKSGMKRVSDDSSGWRPGANNAASVRAGILAARANLSPGQPLFLYSLHHSDAFAPPGCIESALQEAAACVAEGLVRNIGLCNATVPLLDRALRCGAVPLAAVQNEWSLFTREADKELPPSAAASSKKGVLLWCARHNVPFVSYSPLGGLKTRRGERQALGEKVPAIAALAKA